MAPCMVLAVTTRTDVTRAEAAMVDAERVVVARAKAERARATRALCKLAYQIVKYCTQQGALNLA